MNLFNWLRAHILFRRAQAAGDAAQRATNGGLQRAEELLKRDPTNERLLELQRSLQMMAGQNRINQASINIGKDSLDNLRR